MLDWQVGVPMALSHRQLLHCAEGAQTRYNLRRQNRLQLRCYASRRHCSDNLQMAPPALQKGLATNVAAS